MFRCSRDAGYVLITTIIALAVVALIGTASLTWATSGLRLSRRAVESEQAFYLANAGIEEALARVLEGQEPITFSQLLPIAPGLAGTYSVTMTPQEDRTISVVSTGQVGGATRVATARMRPGSQGGGGPGGGPGAGGGSLTAPPGVPAHVYQQAVFSNGSLAFDNNSVICGDLYAVGAVLLGNNTRVEGRVGPLCSSIIGTGKVVATDQVIFGNNSTVAGGWCDATRWGSPATPCPARPSSAPLPDPDFAVLSGQATVRHNAGLLLEGSSAYRNDIVYIDGDLTVDHKGAAISGAVTFVVTGDVHIDRDLTCAGACSVAIIARGTIDSWNNIGIQATLVTTGRLSLGNGVTIRGNLVATTFDVMNNATIYPLHLKTVPVDPGDATKPGLTDWNS